ncbi:MAG: DNA primase [Alphaproteobacteria bacterium]|nr:DNA primase [Alphaproteobacteria bacterium]
MRKGYLADERPIHRIHFVASTLAPALLLRQEARRRWAEASKQFERLRWAVESVDATDRIEEVYCAEVPVHHAFALEDNILTGNCFGCGAHGDAIGFVMRSDSLSFPEAVERLAGEAGLEVPRASPEEAAQHKARASLRDAVEAACAWFETRLRAPEGRGALDYLRRRGLDDATIARFRLGYAPESTDALKRAMAAKNIDEQRLVEAGLLKRPDDGRAPFAFFRDRVMFPITDRAGRVVAFGARTLGANTSGGGQPKYLNSPDTPLFDKGRTLYAFSLARAVAADRNEIVVCEGYMDVIALHQAGFPTAVAPLGTALTEAQLDQLWKVVPEPTLCFDGDAAGQRAASRAAARALPHVGPGRSVRFATLTAGKDPDELIRAKGPQAMREVLDQARPLIDFIWTELSCGRPPDTPERWSALQHTLEQRAAQIEHRETRLLYRDQLLSRYRRWLRETDRAAWAKLRGAAPGWRGRGPGPWNAPGSGVAEHLRSQSGETARLAPHDPVLAGWRIILAALINFPSLSDDLGERLVALEPPNEALDKLLREIHIARSSELDSNGLQRHLCDNGFSDLLAEILSDEVYRSARPVGPQGSLEAAQQYCVAILRGLEDRCVSEELRSLQAKALAAPTLEAVQLAVNAGKLRIEAREHAAAIEDEEPAGTAPQGP